jgi:molecular chaperone GrpE
MAPDKKGKRWNRIPVRFVDSEPEQDSSTESDTQPGSPINSTTYDSAAEEPRGVNSEVTEQLIADQEPGESGDTFGRRPDAKEPSAATGASASATDEAAGPVLAELIATRAELKRMQGEVSELADKLARRQADFENYRKRMDRERAETYNRVVAELAAKLLPVLDNLGRALDAEASVEASESDEFRHFLSGVDLIYKQLSGVLENWGVKPVAAVGERFDPHVHEAVVTEGTDDYEPDTVMQEIVRGYQLGGKLIRPALVKVAVKP